MLTQTRSSLWHGNDGFILMTTLCMLILVSLLTLYQMQLVLMYTKLLHAQVNEHQHHYQLLKSAQMLYLRGWPDVRCVSEDDDYNQPIEFLKRNQGCDWSYDGVAYRYWVSDLGVFDTILIDQYPSHHWLVSLVSSNDHTQMLQARFASRDKALGNMRHLSEFRQIKEGIMIFIFRQID